MGKSPLDGLFYKFSYNCRRGFLYLEKNELGSKFGYVDVENVYVDSEKFYVYVEKIYVYVEKIYVDYENVYVDYEKVYVDYENYFIIFVLEFIPLCRLCRC